MLLAPLPLSDRWTLSPVAGPVPDRIAAAAPVRATVPGTVHTDLLAAGLIDDPYLDDNERLLAWIGLVEWRYETTFAWADDGATHVDLVFEGLDTVARIELNDVVVARTENMHRTYRIPVRAVLREGANTLRVTFASGVRHADARSLALGARPHVNDHPYNAVRKMACNYGWDWGPDLVTAGIWRPVTLQTWSHARLAAVRPVVGVEGRLGTVEVHVDVERADPSATLVLGAEVAGVAARVRLGPGETTGVVTVVVDGVERWWPRGHGEHPLYDLVVTLDADAGADASDDGQLDAWAGRIGFRTVRLDMPRDERGTGFTFVVNDRPLFVKGANWIPDDAFPHRVTRERYAARLAQAEEAGLNLIRVWGGGIFESDDFYAECDERGLMVWQDFLFACAAYSEEEPMRAEVVAEARDNITRLMPHASLVHWNGSNENVWSFADWGWEPQLDGKSWGSGYYDDVLPALVAELDPGRSYTPSSPFSPGPEHPNDPAHATMHIWDVWNQTDYPAYRDRSPRFVAEFGWQGPPTWSTLRSSVTDDPMTPESPGMLIHQKAADGNAKLTRGLVAHLPVPDEMEDWHWAMSLNQARAVQVGIEHFRSLAPWCAGSIVWQLNDCWPVTSWAAVDGYGRRKPLLYALQHAHAPRLVTIQPRGGGLAVVLVNDTPLAWSAPVVLTRVDFGGAVRARADLHADVAPWSVATIELPPDLREPEHPTRELVVADVAGVRGLWWFVEDRDSELPPPRLTSSVTATADGVRVELTAISILRDLALLVDKVAPDAVIDDMLVTLLPGERATWLITGVDGLVPPDAYVTRSTLRTANAAVL